MRLVAWIVLTVCWCAWFYPFLFRAPHVQKRASITVAGPTRAGLLLECLAIFLAFAFRLQPGEAPNGIRVALSMLLGALAAILSWSSVAHLGRQFRVHAGLYHDHRLIRTGPYAIVRHPIYSSLLAMLLCTLLLLTPWRMALVSLAVFIVGTEIRVWSEDGLLGSRFGAEFAAYRKSVPAYIPFVR